MGLRTGMKGLIISIYPREFAIGLPATHSQTKFMIVTSCCRLTLLEAAFSITCSLKLPNLVSFGCRYLRLPQALAPSTLPFETAVFAVLSPLSTLKMFTLQFFRYECWKSRRRQEVFHCVKSRISPFARTGRLFS